MECYGNRTYSYHKSKRYGGEAINQWEILRFPEKNTIAILELVE